MVGWDAGKASRANRYAWVECFKFRQKRAEQLPSKQCSTGTDLALCLCLHKNSLQRCWIEVGPISCSNKVRCLWLRSIFFLYFILLPPPNLLPRLPSSACKRTVACEELKLTIALDRAGTEPAFPTCGGSLTDMHEQQHFIGRIKECTERSEAPEVFRWWCWLWAVSCQTT